MGTKFKRDLNLKRILIIGAGTMGRGIAQWFAQQGINATLNDLDLSFLKKSKDTIYDSWDKLEKKNKFSKDQILQFKNNLTYDLAPKYHHFDLIIEAVVENLHIKQDIFLKIEQHLKLANKQEHTDGLPPRKVIIATNTSSISIDKIASCLTSFNKEYFLGIHFFNPAPVMKLVELVSGFETSKVLLQQFQSFFQEHLKTAVISKDSPGFIVNRVNRSFYGEALNHLKNFNPENIKLIDLMYKTVAGFRMGPFELMDLIGIDVNFDVTKSVWQQFFFNSRFTPHKIQEDLVNSNRHGKKTKNGFYDYKNPQESELKILRQDQLEENMNNQNPPSSSILILLNKESKHIQILKNLNFDTLFIDEQNLELSYIKNSKKNSFQTIIDLTNFNYSIKNKLINLLCEINSIKNIATDISFNCPQLINFKHKKVGSILSFNIYSPTQRTEIYIKDELDPTLFSALSLIANELNIKLQFTKEKLAFTYPRIISTIINEAFFSLDDDLASIGDIDLAMTNGLNYPIGPFEWAQHLGYRNITRLLDEYYLSTKNDRYACSNLLRQEINEKKTKE